METKRRMEKKKENKSEENNVRKEVFWIWILWTYCVMVCLDTNIFLDLIFFLGWWRGLWLWSHDVSHDIMS